MRRFVRYLRLVFSAFCGVACVLLIVLWFRSYSWVEAIRFMPAANGGAFQCLSIPGRVAVGTIKAVTPWSIFRMSVSEFEAVMGSVPAPPEVPSATWGGWLHSQFVAQLFIPYWMLVLLILVAGSISWFKRFSVRTLLI